MDPLLKLTMAFSLAALFAGSTLHKLMALQEWPGVVRSYRLLPDALAGPAALLLLGFGAFTAAALASAPMRKAGAEAAAVQLLIFGAAMAINIRRGHTQIDCGCFGSRLRQGLSWWMVVRNGVLALAALALLLPAGVRELSVLDGAVLCGCVATLALLYPVIDVVLSASPPTYDENFRASEARLAP